MQPNLNNNKQVCLLKLIQVNKTHFSKTLVVYLDKTQLKQVVHCLVIHSKMLLTKTNKTIILCLSKPVSLSKVLLMQGDWVQQQGHNLLQVNLCLDNHSHRKLIPFLLTQELILLDSSSNKLVLLVHCLINLQQVPVEQDFLLNQHLANPIQQALCSVETLNNLNKTRSLVEHQNLLLQVYSLHQLITINNNQEHQAEVYSVLHPLDKINKIHCLLHPTPNQATNKHQIANWEVLLKTLTQSTCIQMYLIHQAAINFQKKINSIKKNSLMNLKNCKAKLNNKL